jgi:chlorobactene glucosyltransferase
VLFQIIIAVGLLAILLNTILNLSALIRPRRDALLPSGLPLVSIMIPARDEEDTIRACLESLSNQDYVNLEVLVLDDNSTVNTATFVREVSAQDDRIKLFTGKPLPEEWAGKPYACAQLAEKAGGDWLLFVDADTVHETHMVRSVLATAIEHNTALLSGFPRQIAGSFLQKVGIPLIYFIIMSWFPIWWLQNARHPRGSLAIGQFLLFRRADYEAAGGHNGVKSRILEDVWLGIEITRRGGRHLAIDLTPVTACHMYRNVRGMWEGFTKWCYSVASLSLPGLVVLILAAYFFYVARFSTSGCCLRGSGPQVLGVIIVFQVFVVLLIRFMVSERLQESLLSPVLHLPGIIFLMCNAILACVRWVTGAGVTWKNRLYNRESSVK